jgi:hypothetical protein
MCGLQSFNQVPFVRMVLIVFTGTYHVRDEIISSPMSLLHVNNRIILQNLMPKRWLELFSLMQKITFQSTTYILWFVEDCNQANAIFHEINEDFDRYIPKKATGIQAAFLKF